MAFSPDGQHLYASGGGNDALYDFPVRRDVVASRPIRTVILPDHVSAQPGLPALGAGNAYTKGLAVTPDGRYVLVAHEFENAVEIVDTRSYADAQAPLGQPSTLGGPYPYGVAVGPRVTVVNGAPTYMAYVTEQGMGMVAQVMVSGGAGTVVGTTAVGDHPTGVAVSPDGSELYVANADDDTLSILNLDAASGTPAPGATIALHAFPAEQLGATPNAVAVSPDGQRVYVALAGDGAVAVLGTAQSFSSAAVGAGPRRASPAAGSFVVGGMIPAGWYPSGVTVSPDGGRVYIVSAKGLGSRFPGTALGSALVDSYYQIKTSMPGMLQVVPAPTGAALLAGLATVQQDILHATDTDARGPHNPIPAVPISITSPLSLTTTPATTPATPIKYVIEIVKENRTFDQILSDLPGHEGRNLPGTDTISVEPAYAIFGRGVTPNAHALLGDPISATVPATAYTAFATSDNFYSDGEASVQGHYWTAAAPLGPCGGRASGASRARTDAATGRAGGPCHGGEAVGLRAVRRAVDGGGPGPRAPAGGRGPPCRAGGGRLAAAHLDRCGLRCGDGGGGGVAGRPAAQRLRPAQAGHGGLAGRTAGQQPAGRGRVAGRALPARSQPGQRRRAGTAGQRRRGRARGGGADVCPAAIRGQCRRDRLA